jgi:hypothetical protein
MLEGSSFARVLHSESFQHLLLAVFIDKAHTVHEAVSWRPANARLIMLRALVGHLIPLITMSATCPSPYRHSLITYAGLHPDYFLINLGNHRPELSTVIIPMEHDKSRFLDIAFLLPFGTQTSNFEPTIIYSDDLDVLTAMFWWFLDRLASMGLPVEAVDILHAGLSPEHQKKCLDDFKSCIVSFLLASEKVGVGMNFLKVRRVVQYLCKGLTLVRFEQCRGRCARTHGMTGIGYLVAEPRMMDKSIISVQSSHTENPGLVDLLQSDKCCDAVYDRWLEHPERLLSQSPRLCCSRSCCQPFLKPGREHRWIMVTPNADTPSSAIQITASEKDLIYKELISWRLKMWQEEWRSKWPAYGPKSLISDVDLEDISKHAGSITTLDDLVARTHIIHWSFLARPLFNAIQTALATVTGSSVTPLIDAGLSEIPTADPSLPTPAPEPSNVNRRPMQLLQRQTFMQLDLLKLEGWRGENRLCNCKSVYSHSLFIM